MFRKPHVPRRRHPDRNALSEIKISRPRLVFRRQKPPKGQLGIGLNKQHRKAFGLLGTGGVWGVQRSHRYAELQPGLSRPAHRWQTPHLRYPATGMHLCWEGWDCLQGDPTSNQCNLFLELLWKENFHSSQPPTLGQLEQHT